MVGGAGVTGEVGVVLAAVGYLVVGVDLTDLLSV